MPNYKLKEPTLKVPTDPALIGYLAGLIDGEGSIYGNIRGQGTSYTRWQVTVHNNNEELMRWLSRLGGTFRVWSVDKGSWPGNKPVFGWRICGTLNVYLLLSAVEPYLIVKKEKARHVLQSITERLRQAPVNTGSSLRGPRPLVEETHPVLTIQ